MGGKSRFSLPKCPIWDIGKKRFILNRPIIMGILNVTPDSFSDGGLHNSASAAIEFAHQMIAEGADIIDVGGESTRPGAKGITPEQELDRVLPIVEALAAQGVVVSIDTYHPEVAKQCVEAGAMIINDISGFRDPEMIDLASSCDVGVIVMHMAGTPKDMQNDPHYCDSVAEIKGYLEIAASRLERAGVERRRICIDPGPGFGKNSRHNLEILSQMQEFCDMDYPVLAAFSRKATLGTIADIDIAAQRVLPSTSAALIAYMGGARIFRVHDVAETKQALQLASNSAWASYAYEQRNQASYLKTQARSSQPACIDEQCNQVSARPRPTLLSGKRAIIALGSNLGTPLDNILGALRAINTLDGVDLIASSSIYRSEPAYYDDQDDFANAVCWVQTTLTSECVLTKLLQIEQDFHRKRTVSNGPRSLDLDLLDYEGILRDTEFLKLPHPKILERDFTVTPILELAQIMEQSFDGYLSKKAFIDEFVSTKDLDSSNLASFWLSDGKLVTKDEIIYGKLTDKLMDSKEAWPF